MANTVDKVLSIALNEVGYLEKRDGNLSYLYSKTANAGYNNYTKYGYEMHQIYPAIMDYPAYWCDCFVDWCFYKAYGVSNAKALLAGDFDDYTIRSVQLYKNKGAWIPRGSQLPKPGDQIFFNNGREVCHTGLVYAVGNGYVYTVEGNTSAGTSVIANGGGVVKKAYLLSNTRISGYGRPKYDVIDTTAREITESAKKTKKVPNVAKATLKKGSKGVEVKRLQKDLNYLGFAKLTVDSDFGPLTETNLKAFQKKYGLAADGIYGPKSEAKMKSLIK